MLHGNCVYDPQKSKTDMQNMSITQKFLPGETHLPTILYERSSYKEAWNPELPQHFQPGMMKWHKRSQLTHTHTHTRHHSQCGLTLSLKDGNDLTPPQNTCVRSAVVQACREPGVKRKREKLACKEIVNGIWQGRVKIPFHLIK